MVFPFCIIGAQLIASGIVLVFSNPRSDKSSIVPANSNNVKVDDVVGSSYTGWKWFLSTLWANLPKTGDAFPWWAPVVGFAVVMALLMAVFVTATLQESPALRELRATFAREDEEMAEDANKGEDGEREEESDGPDAFPEEHRAAYLAGYRRGCRARAGEAREGEQRANLDHTGASEQEKAGEVEEGVDVAG